MNNMKFAIIDNGIVVNIAVADAAIHSNWIPWEDGVNIGDSWDGSSFAPAPSPPALTPAEIDALRRTAYQQEADPLFFKSQRGEATTDEWLAKVQEIRSRYQDAA